ncbi:MAG: signal peptidase II [Chlamydiales bacterium]|nr:signal peptidase II [Chlamydiales bacterium]
MNRSLLLFLASLLILASDFFLKSYAHHFLPMMGWGSELYPYGGVAVFENWAGIDFSINHVLNKGAAWGMLSNFHQYLFYARLLIVGGMIVYFFLFAVSKQRLPLVLIISGALGNILDHLIYGYVIDMFHFRFWGHSFPVFNIADSAIFCGIAWLMIHSLIKPQSVDASENV